MTVRMLVLLSVLTVLAAWPDTAWAQKTAAVTIPAGVSFSVPDVTRSVTGTPGPFRVSFSASGLRPSDRFYISVKADTTNFTGPGTTQIPASKISWTTSGAVGGSASAGTLSSAAYTQVYKSSANTSSGSVDLTWTLASIAAAGLRAGTHSLTVRWRVEAF